MRFMAAKALELLKRLTESFGPSGFEREPVSLIKSYVPPFADEIKSDKRGSLHLTARGKATHPVILLPGDVDDVDNAIALLMGVVTRLDGKTAEAFTAI